MIFSHDRKHLGIALRTRIYMLNLWNELVLFFSDWMFFFWGLVLKSEGLARDFLFFRPL